MVRLAGVEPARPKALPPEDSVSAIPPQPHMSVCRILKNYTIYKEFLSITTKQPLPLRERLFFSRDLFVPVQEFRCVLSIHTGCLRQGAFIDGKIIAMVGMYGSQFRIGNAEEGKAAWFF